MGVVRMSQPDREGFTQPAEAADDAMNWARVVAGGSLVAAGLLLLTGRRRAGLLAVAGGTTLAVLDQKDVIVSLWNALPSYIETAQSVLGKVQQSLEEVSIQRDRLHNILQR